MAEITAEQPQPEAPAAWPMKRAGARVVRWFFYSVALAIVPILISFAWLPQKSSITMLLSHGDLAVMASALFGLSMGEVFGSKEPLQKWLREVLIIASFVLWAGCLLLLSFISGNAPRFTASEEVKYSWYLLLAAVVIGAASFAATVSRN